MQTIFCEYYYFISHSNIPASPAYVQFIFHNSYVILELVCFLIIAQLLKQKVFKQAYVTLRLKSSLQKLHGRHHELVDSYEISISQMIMDFFLFM